MLEEVFFFFRFKWKVVIKKNILIFPENKRMSPEKKTISKGKNSLQSIIFSEARC